MNEYSERGRSAALMKLSKSVQIGTFVAVDGLRRHHGQCAEKAQRLIAIVTRHAQPVEKDEGIDAAIHLWHRLVGTLRGLVIAAGFRGGQFDLVANFECIDEFLAPVVRHRRAHHWPCRIGKSVLVECHRLAAGEVVLLDQQYFQTAFGE